MLQNELSILEFIHMIVETYDSYFEGVCELDVSYDVVLTSIFQRLFNQSQLS